MWQVKFVWCHTVSQLPLMILWSFPLFVPVWQGAGRGMGERLGGVTHLFPAVHHFHDFCIQGVQTYSRQDHPSASKHCHGGMGSLMTSNSVRTVGSLSCHVPLTSYSLSVWLPAVQYRILNAHDVWRIHNHLNLCSRCWTRPTDTSWYWWTLWTILRNTSK